MKFLRPGWILFGGFAFILLSSILYDKFLGFDDGFIRGIAFKRVLICIALFLIVFLTGIKGVRSKSKALQNLSLFTLSLVFCLFILELFSFIGIRTGLVKKDGPKHHLFTDASDLVLHKRPFWGDYNPDFSKWYLPHDTMSRVNCQGDSLFSYTNSYGARDTEREKRSAKKRVVLIGDSFIEGFMVNQDLRLSNLLENRTGMEHLNFGINGTSTINYYLTYKHLAAQFDHDVVVVGILPANDFEDFTSGKMASLIEMPMHRPYWAGTYPNYKLSYSLASIDQSGHSLHHFNAPSEIPAVIDSVFCSLSFSDQVKAALQDNSYTWHLISYIGEKLRPQAPAEFTRFSTYSQEEWNIFSYSLEKLFEEAKGKKIILLLLPILNDIKAYDVNKDRKLTRELETLVKGLPDIAVLDLVPAFHQNPGKWEDLYVQCDGHWSEAGERFASELILNHPFYQAAISDTAAVQN